jgi:hypothetical protein
MQVACLENDVRVRVPNPFFKETEMTKAKQKLLPGAEEAFFADVDDAALN